MPRKKVKTEEWYAVILSLIYYFSILAAYYVMRPIRDQLAVEVGSTQLPWFFGATFVATLILTPLFGFIVSYWPRRVIMPLVYLFFMICQVAFVPLFENKSLLSPKFLGILFFVWVSVFNLFVISVFWSFMTDIWNDVQARRLFPVIALGGTAGAVVGPIITRSLVAIIGLPSLLAVSALLLAVAVVCIFFLGRWAHLHGAHREEVGNESAVGGGMLDGLKQIFTNHFIGCMSLIMLLSDAIGTIAYALVTDYSGFAFPHDVIAQTQFAASMDLSSNVIQTILQLTLTRWLLVRYGAGSLFVLVATIVVISCLSLLFVDPYIPLISIMPPIALLLIITRSLAHGMLQPARETLYTLVPRDLRYKGKNAVDTVVWRAGDVISMLSVNGFRALGLNVAGFGVIWAVLAAISGMIGWRLSNQVENTDTQN